MKLLDRLLEKFGCSGSDQDLEQADRRAFMFGLAVTPAALLVPRATIFLPSSPRLDDGWVLIGGLLVYGEGQIVKIPEGQMMTYVQFHKGLSAVFDAFPGPPLPVTPRSELTFF